MPRVSGTQPESALHCARCTAPLGIRWYDRRLRKRFDTTKWMTRKVGDETVSLCSPCYAETSTGNHAARRKMHNKPLIGQMNLFDDEIIDELRSDAPKRKHRQGA